MLAAQAQFEETPASLQVASARPDVWLESFVKLISRRQFLRPFFAESF
jgi:hypothetical protein